MVYPTLIASVSDASHPSCRARSLSIYREALKKKINVDSRNYRILGACNPALAHKALEIEDKVGTMLPCNVVVQDVGGGRVEVAAIDPVASMQAIENPRLKVAAEEVRRKLHRRSLNCAFARNKGVHSSFGTGARGCHHGSRRWLPASLTAR